MNILRIGNFVVCLLLVTASLATARTRYDVVVLDPGHGGKDRGAIWGGVHEATLNLQVAKRVERLLKARGIKVVMTRRNDTYVGLSRRAQIANRYKNAIFVSIHFNACTITSVHGAETFYLGTQGKIIAYEIQNQLINLAKLSDRKIRKRSYKVLAETRCPAVLVECGYLSHPGQRKLSTTKRRQQNIAQSIVNGLVEYRE